MDKKWIEAEIGKINAQIDRLTARREAFEDMLKQISGIDMQSQSPPLAETVRKRATNVKPLILDIMTAVGAAGATTMEVDERVREKVPTVAHGTVGAVLSRLKGEGALAYDGDRYYIAQLAPVRPQLRVAL